MIRAILILSLLYSVNLFSSGYLTNLGQGVTVQKVHAHGSGGITLWVDATKLKNPDQCDRMDKVHIRSSLNGYNAMVTAVMTAYSTNKKIGMWSTGCSVIPFWGGTKTAPILRDVWITD